MKIIFWIRNFCENSIGENKKLTAFGEIWVRCVTLFVLSSLGLLVWTAGLIETKYFIVCLSIVIFSEVPSLLFFRRRLLEKRLAQASDSPLKQVNPTIGSFSLFWAAMLQKPEEREFVLGCLEERFDEDFKKFGKSRAYKLFWRDVLMSIYPAFESKFSRVIKWSVWGYIIEKFISR